MTGNDGQPRSPPYRTVDAADCEPKCEEGQLAQLPNGPGEERAVPAGADEDRNRVLVEAILLPGSLRAPRTSCHSLEEIGVGVDDGPACWTDGEAERVFGDGGAAPHRGACQAIGTGRTVDLRFFHTSTAPSRARTWEPAPGQPATFGQPHRAGPALNLVEKIWTHSPGDTRSTPGPVPRQDAERLSPPRRPPPRTSSFRGALHRATIALLSPPSSTPRVHGEYSLGTRKASREHVDFPLTRKNCNQEVHNPAMEYWPFHATGRIDRNYPFIGRIIGSLYPINSIAIVCLSSRKEIRYCKWNLLAITRKLLKDLGRPDRRPNEP